MLTRTVIAGMLYDMIEQLRGDLHDAEAEINAFEEGKSDRVFDASAHLEHVREIANACVAICDLSALPHAGDALED